MMWQFLNGKLITIGFCSLAFIFCIIFLVMLQIPFGTIMMISLTYLVLFGSWLVVTYVVEKSRLYKLRQLILELDKAYLLGEVLPEPKSLIEQKYFEVVKTISHDAITRVEAANRASIDYKEYVEVWIHELKTPLTAMSLMLANEPNIRKLRRELKRADNLTDNILHYARLQTLEKDKQFSWLQIEPLLNKAVKNQMDLLIAAKMRVKIDGDFSVYSDSKAMQFIINQLLINSAKYCPGSEITMTATDGMLIYKDNGIGILAHEIPRILERGYTGTNGRKLGTSTGMGLYIVATLCKELNIHLSISSEVDQYTRFQFTFSNLTKL